MKRVDAQKAYEEMTAKGVSFEDSAEEVCRNLGIPRSLANIYAEVMIYQVRQTLTTFDFGPSHLVSGNVPDEQRERVNILRDAMEKSKKGRKMLSELGFSDKNAIPVPGVIDIDDEGYFLTPRYRLQANSSEIQSELDDLRTRALAAAQRKFTATKRK